jgi:YbbR domain-containing protein
MIRRLLNDLSSVVLALTLAITVWVVATNEQYPSTKKIFPEAIPIQVVNKAEGMVIFDPEVVESVRLTVRAPETSWDRLTAAKFEAKIDLEGLPAGRHDVEVQVACTDRFVEILEKQPPEVSIRLEEYEEKELEVQARVMDNPHVAYIGRTPVITPSIATVGGPASIVDQVSELVAEIYLRVAKETVEQSVSLSARDEGGQAVGWVDIDPPAVNVRVPIEQRRNYKEVSVRPIVEGEVASGYRVSSVSVDPSNTTIFGSPLAIEGIPGYLETTPIDVSDAQANVAERVTLNLPQGVTVLGEQSVLVTISVTAIESSLTVQRELIIQGLRQDLNATPSPEAVDVILSGPVPKLDALKPEDVQVILGLFDLQWGTYKITPEVVVPEGLKVESILPDTIEVEITIATSAAPTNTPQPTETPPPTETPTQPTETPPPTETPQPTETLEPMATVTPTPPQPTSTPTLTTTPTPIPSPTPTPVLLAECPDPGARITYPTVNAVLKGTVQILGSAYVNGNNTGFDYYKFEFRRKDVSDWSFLQRFEDPVTEGLLGIWDTSSLPPGDYWLRLVVVRKDGNFIEPCQVPVQVSK